MLTLRQMRYFDALAATRHFGKAAELTHVSQPALSAQIMEMEEHLGVKLVERSRAGVFLTVKGEEVLAQVRSILADVGRLEESARTNTGTLEGRVRLGVIPTLAPYLVPRLIPYLRERYPAIEIELKESLTDRLIADLGDGRLDAVVAALPVEGGRHRHPGAVFRPLLYGRGGERPACAHVADDGRAGGYIAAAVARRRPLPA